ncbi:MAG TPA: HEAT repeat domain-containing protein [Pirellulales bacterium]|nr:HEAT repeat domain-containing protein [Pirellulales bacterium]
MKSLRVLLGVLAVMFLLASLRGWAEEESPTGTEANPSEVAETKVRPTTHGAPVQEPSRELQRTLLQKMKSKKPAIRVAAVRELAEFPTAESARFLAQHGLGSDHGDVRKAAYDTFLELNEQEPVAGFLLDTVAREAKRASPRGNVCGMLAIAMASSDEGIERRALDVFDQAASRAQAGVALVLAMVDELGGVGDETSVDTLMKVSKRPVFQDRFAIRRAVVQSLIKITLPKSTDALVALLTTATGEVRGDIVRHLTATSGQKFGLDPPAWAAWWKKKQGKGGGASGSLADGIQWKSSYYGLPIYAARLVFVLDTSASMSGGRILAAKRELSTAIASLPDGTYFNVLAFDIGVWPWSAQLMPASASNKAEAVAWVQLRPLGSQTASYNALDAAFGFDAEAIYFLTDGQPAGGTIDNPLQIIEVLSRLNQTRRLTINSIGVDVGLPGPANPFDLFLAGLAARNFGEYRRVDQ